jgi:hypothetical protein
MLLNYDNFHQNLNGIRFRMRTDTFFRRQFERLLLVSLSVLLCAVFLYAHSRYPGVPSANGETGGWNDWNDQSLYIRAAQAWAIGDLSSGQHAYPPGYALLAAWMRPITPGDRFLLPNIACLIVSQWACASLSIRMFPRLRFARAVGAAAFLIASVGTVIALKSWLVPWTSTPAAAMTLLTLVAVLRLSERPSALRAALAGAALGAIVIFRPADSAPVALASSLAMLPTLIALPVRRAVVVATIAILSSSAMLGIAALLTGISSGFGPASYIALSKAVGFEFRLLPMRWVTLVIDARPIWDGVGTERVEPGLHLGLAEVFPWFIPGVAGMAACLVSKDAKRVHVILALWFAAHMALMLCYRDLHILSFWLYGNYHYFKVVQPVLLLFAAALPLGFFDGTLRLREGFAAVATVVLAFGWRAVLVPGLSVPVTATSQNGIVLPSLNHLSSAAIVVGQGSWASIYKGDSVLAIGGEVFHLNQDFKIYPRSKDFLVFPLRKLPRGPAVLHVVDGIDITADIPSQAARQKIVFGLPCAFGLAGATDCGTEGVPLNARP